MRLNIDLPDGGYPVIVTADKYKGLGPALVDVQPGLVRCIVVSNEVVWPLFEETILGSLKSVGVAAHCIVIPDGETEKSVERWSWLVHQMLGLEVDRQTPIIAVGGGVVGDLAGFAAATVMRGLPLIQVPTSLLAMVDSSVGGKTAINTEHGKNLLGSFYQPSMVYASVDCLRHLPEQEMKSGLGEVVKHGMLSDGALLASCRTNRESIARRETQILEELVVRSVRIKSEFVVADEKEAGVRALLNLGHTVGHAIESTLVGSPNAMPHGICVGIGVLAEVAWAHGRGACSRETVDAFRETLVSLDMPTEPPKLDKDLVLRASRFDKKARRGKLWTPIVEAVGQVKLIEIGVGETSELFHSLPGFRDA